VSQYCTELGIPDYSAISAITTTYTPCQPIKMKPKIKQKIEIILAKSNKTVESHRKISGSNYPKIKSNKPYLESIFFSSFDILV